MKRFIVIALFAIIALLPAYWWLDKTLSTKVEPHEVNLEGVVGHLRAKEGIRHQTTILLLGGGPWGDYWGQFFAQRGFVSLSLANSRSQGQPTTHEEIPLEYYQKAIDWLVHQPQVNPHKVLVMGASRNAELALLLAATFPDKIRGAVAYCPSAVTWSNTVLPYNSDELKPSWTWRNRPVPYLAMEKIKPNSGHTITTLSYWLEGLRDSARVEQAFIKVEQISGPILLLSGKDDQVWPASLMSNLIERRLVKSKFPFPFYNIQYEKAGHSISGDPDQISSQLTGEMVIAGKKFQYQLGGTPEGDHLAKLQARDRVLELVSNL